MAVIFRTRLAGRRQSNDEQPSYPDFRAILFAGLNTGVSVHRSYSHRDVTVTGVIDDDFVSWTIHLASCVYVREPTWGNQICSLILVNAQRLREAIELGGRHNRVGTHHLDM